MTQIILPTVADYIDAMQKREPVSHNGELLIITEVFQAPEHTANMIRIKFDNGMLIYITHR